MSIHDDLINNNGNIINISPCGGGSKGVTSVGLTSEDGSVIVGGSPSPIKKSGTYDLSLPKVANNTGKFLNATVTIDEYGRVIKAETGGASSEYVNVIDENIISMPLEPFSTFTPMNPLAPVDFPLPTTVAKGTTFKVIGFGAGGWKITQQPGQLIYFGNRLTTMGTEGGINSTVRTDSVMIVCVVANTTFTLIPLLGRINIT